ncbi:AAA family ATPase [Polyangium fumosum]|uniref:GAF domain-containing protein n=1 Tax=Polyangium fumosum TaxID=889272 RepID=A0A4U1JCJ6_9BACT|nr:AAA family ATPase [Polyangium fumosum]TKD08332.1 GAF domain-containing protein [Polyangium fumosum]
MQHPPYPAQPVLALEPWLRAAIAAADALAKLHQSGIIHQNIRPQTLRIEPAGEGVELVGAEGYELTASMVLTLPLDALPYIAPEQTGRLEAAIDHRVDLYSLGVVLYELCAGTLPFHADDAVGWVHCHVARAPRPLADVTPETPVIVSEIVMRLLAKSPEERYQSARGLTHDLERCLSELTAHGHIEPFPLGAQDVWDKLRAASRMYGRRADLAALHEILERVRETGLREVVIVKGPSGIGKSAILRELQREAGSARAIFLWGTFEEQRRDIPYATLGQAFEGLIRHTIASTDAELAAVREELAAALGDNGQLIIGLVPQIQLVIGKQPPVTPLPPAEARARLHQTFRAFVSAFACRERPLVLVLDNLQWADFASLELLQHILTHPEGRSLLLIGTEREDEDEASQPAQAMLREVQKAGVAVHERVIRPLGRVDLMDLVVDLFGCDRKDAEPLAALLWTKTGGNPFFAGQLLGALHQDQLIRFDTRRWAWVWDIAELEAKEITDDMVELVLGKLRRLPQDTLDLLKLAACIGSEFSVTLLGTLSERTPEEARRALESALTEGLLLQRPDGYKFMHTRVHQAAYSMIQEQERAGLHLRLGWLLLERTPESGRDALLFDIANQLNLGANRALSAEDRRRISELDLAAGRKAKAASAPRSAAAYLSTGVSMLPPDPWDVEYTLTYGLTLELAESEFMLARFEETERLCATVVERARTLVERSAAHRLQIRLAIAQVNNARAIEVALSCLRELGVDLPASPTPDDVRAELVAMRAALRGHAIEELVDLPAMTDPSMVAAMQVLASVYPATVYAAMGLTDMAVTRMVRLSIEHGMTSASVSGFAHLGTVLCASFGEYQEGYRFGKLACELTRRPGFGDTAPQALAGFATTTLPWSRHMREALDPLRNAFKAARESGQHLYAAIDLVQNVMILLALGEPLEAAYEATLTAFEFANNAKYGFLAENVRLMQRFIRCLCGDTERFGSFSGDGFDEGAFAVHLRETNIPLVRLFFFTYQLIARYLAHDYEGALASAEAAAELSRARVYGVSDAECCLYTGLTLAALLERAEERNDKGKLRAELDACEATLRSWAASCPDNFACRHALVLAEIARLEGRDHDASTLYDRAIRDARAAGFIQIEALACELAGRFSLRRGLAVLPAAFFREARTLYARWGARGKVRQLEALHPDLLAEPRRESGPTPAANSEPIDTLTAAKASAAISSDMSPDQLLATLMRILIEHAGAQRACLLLPSAGTLGVAADVTSDQDGVRVDIPKGARVPSAVSFPLSIAHYVRRTREKLMLDDVAAQGMFSADPYLSKAPPKSMLCAPIVRRGEVAGILYLENNLARGVFTARRLALLEFLSAISLENALLAADLARETAERTQAERTLRESEERLARLVETASVVPWEARAETARFTYVGPKVAKMLGYPQDAWLGPDFLSKYVHPEDRESTLMHFFAATGDDDFDFRMTASDGRTVWLHNVFSSRAVDEAEVLGGFLFDVTERKEAEATLREKLRIIEEQQAAIRSLSTPIIEVWEGVLTMPVLGSVNEKRAAEMMSVVLEAVTRTACEYTIIDLTGVDTVDTATADYIMRIVRAVQLLGAQAIVVGIRPEVAQTIVSMGVDLSSIATLSTLRAALLRCMRAQGSVQVKGAAPKAARQVRK